MSKQRIKLGFCSQPHGIKGGLHFRLENEQDSILQEGMQLWLQPSGPESQLPAEGAAYTLAKISFGHKVMAYLDKVTTREEVEAMVPFEIYVDRSLFPQTEEDEVYLNDLLNLPVFDHSSGEKIGVVEKFYDNTAQPILVIRGQQKLELPLVEAFFPLIDVENERIEVIVPELVE